MKVFPNGCRIQTVRTPRNLITSWRRRLSFGITVAEKSSTTSSSPHKSLSTRSGSLAETRHALRKHNVPPEPTIRWHGRENMHVHVVDSQQRKPVEAESHFASSACLNDPFHCAVRNTVRRRATSLSDAEQVPLSEALSAGVRYLCVVDPPLWDHQVVMLRRRVYVDKCQGHCIIVEHTEGSSPRSIFPNVVLLPRWPSKRAISSGLGVRREGEGTSACRARPSGGISCILRPTCVVTH